MKIEVGTQFIYSGSCGVHTIEEIDDYHVTHSYTYLNAKGEEVEADAFMYREVFDNLVEKSVIVIL